MGKWDYKKLKRFFIVEGREGVEGRDSLESGDKYLMSVFFTWDS